MRTNFPDLCAWVVAKSRRLVDAEKIIDPETRISKVDKIDKMFNPLADPSWVTNDRHSVRIRDRARKEMADEEPRWNKVMDLAEEYGFIVGSYGGVTSLMTHENQKEQGIFEKTQRVCGRIK